MPPLDATAGSMRCRLYAMRNGREENPGSPIGIRERQRKRLIFYPLTVALLALVIGGLVAYFSVVTFDSPDLDASPTGFIAVAMTGDSVKPVGIGIDNSDNVIRYDILFPKEDVGQRWALILAGSARLSTAIPFVGGAPVPRSSTVVCNAPIDTEAQGCQIFTGIVTASSGSLGFLYGCDKLVTPNTGSDDYFGSAEINGQAPISSSANWAYQVVMYPDEQTTASDAEPTNSVTINFDKFTRGAQVVPAVVCDTMTGPNGYGEFVKSIPAPNGFSGNEEEWDNPSTTFVSGVFKRPQAEAFANAGIIFAGACFAITTGFLPLSFQAWLENSEPKNPARPKRKRLVRLKPKIPFRAKRVKLERGRSRSQLAEPLE
jgi:hypothetical protein